MSRTLHVIGNVQLDVVANDVDRLPEPGGDEVIDHIAVRPAGAAGNVALALAALQVPHRLFGAVGDDYAGRLVAQELAQAGVAGDLQVVPGGETGISIAVEAPARERAFFTAHGVLRDFDLAMIPSVATRADLVVLTGYFSMPALRGAGMRELLSRARAADALTVFDTGWDPDNWTGEGASEVLGHLSLVDVFLPNEPEAIALTGEADATRAILSLRQHCDGWIVVKRGENGVVACGPGQDPFSVPALKVRARDTTGAGDSLAAGIVAELVEGRSMREAIETGVNLASAVVARDSRSRYPSREELRQAVRP